MSEDSLVGGGRCYHISRGRPGILLNTPLGTGTTPPEKGLAPRSTVPRLRSWLGLKKTNNEINEMKIKMALRVFPPDHETAYADCAVMYGPSSRHTSSSAELCLESLFGKEAGAKSGSLVGNRGYRSVI